MKYRNITDSIIEALSDSPVVLLNGARQTGKSTLVKWISEERYPARYITFDDAAALSSARHDPAGFLSGLGGNIILDEIQRAPELFMAIKAGVDLNRRPGRFLLTGSANVLLLPRLSESLAGRMEIISLWPFSQGEIEGRKEAFIDMSFAAAAPPGIKSMESRADIIRRLVAGGYPEVLNRPSYVRRKAWFGSYLTTILQRDVRDLANIDGITILPRLMSLLAARTASLLNFAELSRSSGIPQSTLKRYMALLETTFLIRLLPAWSGNPSKRLVKTSKLFLNDTGLAAYLLGVGEINEDSFMAGQLLENFVFLELLKQVSWSDTQPGLFYFRTQAGHEVDFLLEGPGRKLVGIEVKAAKSLGERDFSALRALSETFDKKLHRGILLYLGDESLSFGRNLFALPIQTLWLSA